MTTWGTVGQESTWDLLLEDHEHEIKQQFLLQTAPEANPTSREAADVQGCKEPSRLFDTTILLHVKHPVSWGILYLVSTGTGNKPVHYWGGGWNLS
jgi:hypothetical protein